MEKRICEECGIEKNLEQNYYLSRIPNEEKMDICKSCFKDKYYLCSKDAFKKYNLPFLYDLWESTKAKVDNDKVIGIYMSKINSLPQYKGLEWKDSKLDKEIDEVIEINFYDDIVKNLKKEAEKLNRNLIIFRETSRMNDYIATLKSLRETLELISKYDWKLNYSEYKIEDRDEKGMFIKQISVWEQNHDNQIRSHKIWNVNRD
jgi:hypothetical protein